MAVTMVSGARSSDDSAHTTGAIGVCGVLETEGARTQKAAPKDGLIADLICASMADVPYPAYQSRAISHLSIAKP